MPTNFFPYYLTLLLAYPLSLTPTNLFSVSMTCDILEKHIQVQYNEVFILFSLTYFTWPN